MDYKRDEHGQTSSPTNLVCTPKRRKALLVGEIERECRALIQMVAAVHAKNAS